MERTPIKVNQIPDKRGTSELLVQKMHRLLNDVRARAYELFERRGRDNGYDRDDWFRSEADLGVLRPARVEETEAEIRIRFERSELSSDQLKVYAESQAITVEGSGVQTNGSGDSQNRTVTVRSLFGRYEVPVQIDAGAVTATLEDGVLEILARKAESVREKPLPVDVNSAPLTPPVQKDESAAVSGRYGTS